MRTGRKDYPPLIIFGSGSGKPKKRLAWKRWDRFLQERNEEWKKDNEFYNQCITALKAPRVSSVAIDDEIFLTLAGGFKEEGHA